MVDICFSGSDCLGWLLNEAKEAISSDGVLALGLNLNYGSLDGDIIAEQASREADTLRYYYKSITDDEIQHEYKALLKKNRKNRKRLSEIFEGNQEIRVWVNNTAKDRCGLFWLCNIAKNHRNKIATVVCPGYTYTHPGREPYVNTNWALSDPEIIISFSDKYHTLSRDEITAYSDCWEMIVKENAKLRILLDDNIVGVEEDFFDHIILGFVTDEPKTQYFIMGKMLGKWQGGCDVAFISKRVEHLIKSNRIKVCEEKIDEDDCYWQRTLALR